MMEIDAQEWRRRCEMEQHIRLQRESELQHAHDYIVRLEQRFHAADQAAQSRQALEIRAGLLAQVSDLFCQSQPSSVDRNIHSGCEAVIDAVVGKHHIAALQVARTEVADALHDVLDVAGNQDLYGAEGEILRLASKSMLSVKGIVLMGIWTVFKNASDSGDGDLETLLPDSVASIESMLAKYETGPIGESVKDDVSDGDDDDDDVIEVRHAQRDLSSNASPPVNGDVVVADARDQFLLDQRRKGVSYSDIKRLGGFQEAESTLRGRYRVLVKEKSDRVRKPQWSIKDKAILRQAVKDTASLSPGLGLVKRIPWKRVGGRMVELGASYPFGPATCAKQWDKINGK